MYGAIYCPVHSVWHEFTLGYMSSYVIPYLEKPKKCAAGRLYDFCSCSNDCSLPLAYRSLIVWIFLSLQIEKAGSVKAGGKAWL